MAALVDSLSQCLCMQSLWSLLVRTYTLFSTSDQVNLLSAIIDSQIDQDFIVTMLTTLSSRASVLHCSESRCLLEHAIKRGKLHVAACLLYDLFVDPIKHMGSWLASLGCYSDDVILHFIDSLLLRTTLTECDSAITAIYENTYGALIRQKRFDSLRVINAHVKTLCHQTHFSVISERGLLMRTLLSSIYLQPWHHLERY